MTSHEAFRGALRSVISKAENWPLKPDPRLKIEIQPHGWLLPILIQCESSCWGRWDHWFRTMEAGRVLDEPVPQIDFQPDAAGLARKMHEKSLDAIARGSWLGWDSWRIFDYYLDWLLYAFGSAQQPEPPHEVEEGAFARLYQVFCLEAMIAWPADLFGDMLAENRHGRANGFFPTPHSLVELMTKLTFGGGGDHRLQTVNDPCTGTGRMLLHASNHSYRLYGQDINATVLKACAVNAYCFAPWMVRGFPFLKDDAEEAVESVALPEPAQTHGSAPIQLPISATILPPAPVPKPAFKPRKQPESAQLTLFDF